MKTQSPSICLVEDDFALREALEDLIRSESNYRLLASFPDAESAIAEIPGLAPDAVVMDIQLPGISGIGCTEQLIEKLPDVLIMMVTVFDNKDRIFQALAAGATGYLLKRDAPEKLISALDELFEGGSPMSPVIARQVVQKFQKPLKKSNELNLTPREQEILELLAKGSLYKEIAWDLKIGVETVRFHLRNIYKKLHVRTRTEAVVKYLGGA
ncbi:MAG: response regulator transcription factor [Akkermansiaceae bacterium]